MHPDCGTKKNPDPDSSRQINTAEELGPGLELLSILAMLLIIAHHYVNTSSSLPLIYEFPTFTRSLFFLTFGAWGKTAINCLILMTGYTMCNARISARTFSKLFLEIAFYNVVFFSSFSVCGYSTFTAGGLLKAFFFPRYATNNFFSCYLLFYLCIPFLNILIHNMSEVQHGLLIGLTGYIYVVLSTVQGASVTMNYVSWFCVLYFIAAYIRLYPKKIFDNTKILFPGLLFVLFLSVFSIVDGAQESAVQGKRLAYYYLSEANKILAVLTAVLALLFFKNLKMPHSKLIRQAAASSFGVYCIHANSEAMQQWLWVDTLKNRVMYNYPWQTHLFHAAASVLCVYLVCVILDQLRSALIEKPFFHVWDNHMNPFINKIQQYFKEFWKYRDLLKLLVTKNIKLKYRRSWLGYVWSILNPLLIMAVMTVVFSTMFKRNIENFPVYLFCGQLLFNFMNTATTQSQFSITGNAALLKKTYVPKYLFTLAKVTSCLVDLLFSLGALVIVILITKAKITLYALLFPLVLLQLYVFCVGLGLFLAQASVFFKDTQFIYSAVTTAWMYLSCIFYPIESLSKELAWGIQHFNPMYFYIGQFRALVYAGTMPEPYLILSGIGAAAAMMVLGIWSFLKTKDEFILHI